MIIGTLAEIQINRARQKGVETLNESLAEHSLNDLFVEKLTALSDSTVFHSNLKIKVGESEIYSDWYPKIELRLALSHDSSIIGANALVRHRKDPKLKAKYQKAYLSIRYIDLPKQDDIKLARLTLLENPKSLRAAIEAAIDDVIGLFEEDFRHSVFQEAKISAKEQAAVPAIYGTSYGTSYKGMRIVRDVEDRTVLVSRGSGNLVANVPTSWLEDRKEAIEKR